MDDGLGVGAVLGIGVEGADVGGGIGRGVGTGIGCVVGVVLGTGVAVGLALGMGLSTQASRVAKGQSVIVTPHDSDGAVPPL